VEKFIRELKAAKRRGVDVDKVFVENRVRETEEMLFMGVRIFALLCSVAGVFLGPAFVIAAQVYVAEHHLQGDVKIPSELVHWMCCIGLMSILSTSFPLIDIWPLIKGRDKCDVEILEDED
jgi:hypothetical protein